MRSFRFTRSIPGTLVFFLVTAAPVRAQQITLGQIDNFNDGATQNWTQGHPPGGVSVVNGGPGGASDPFMQIAAAGGFGTDSKLIVFNTSQWSGNYNAAGVGAIEMDLKDISGGPLSIRISLRDTTGFGYSSTNAFPISADGLWHHTAFRLDQMTAIGTPPTLSQFLSNVPELRILSSAVPSLNGDAIVATLGVDNIHAIAAAPEPTGILFFAAGAGFRGWWLRRRRV
jgi:hypothetical protein